MIVHYMPLVTDANRADWEAYAMANRFQIDEAFLEEHRSVMLRTWSLPSR